ncbi:MAG: DUF3810 family protein, partial [Saprospiraceae bacterium]
MKKTWIAHFGILAGLLTIVIHFIAGLGFELQFFEFYHLWIFPVVRIIYDYTFGLIPVPVIYVLFLILVYFGVLNIYRAVKKYGEMSLRAWILNGLIFWLNFLGTTIFLFYFLWGFNYYRPSIEEQLRLADVHIDSTGLLNEYINLTNELMHERKAITSDSSELQGILNWGEIENDIRDVQEDLLTSWGDHIHGRVRVRRLFPQGMLLRISTAGVYIPFVSEGHIDPGMHGVQWPFTAAHEMAHGYGYTDEGVCNFIGLLTCLKSENHFIRYSGLLGYWRYLFYELCERYPDEAKVQYKMLDAGVKNDLSAIRQALD